MKIMEGIYWVGSGAVGLSSEGDCHTYLVRSGDRLALVDCGMNREPDLLLKNIKKDGLKIENIDYVLLTHAHPDHVGGCSYLQKNYGVKIVCSAFEASTLSSGPNEVFGLTQNGKPSEEWLDWPGCEADVIVEDQDHIKLGSLDIAAISTPGHTEGSVCYLLETEGRRILFSGDTIFYKGFISILSAPFSNLARYRESILKLQGLEIDGLFPAHLMWVLAGGQCFIDQAAAHFREYRLPPVKPFT